MMHSQNNYHNNMNMHNNSMINYPPNNLQHQPNHTNNSLFIGDLSKFCTEQDLEALFGKYGEITDVKIKRNITTGKTLSYGFVTFVDDECASHAMEELDGFLYGGRNLRIRWAVHNIRDQKVEEQIINSVYVRFITTNINELITEEHFHKVFDQFGNVEDVSIKESTLDKRTSRQSGYGFVHFSCNNAGIAAAFQAVSVVDNQTFDSVLYNVELSKNLLRQFNELQENRRRGLAGSKPLGSSFNSLPLPPPGSTASSMSIIPPAHHHHHHHNNDRMNNNYRDHNNFRSAPESGFNNNNNNYQANNNNHQHGGMNHRYPYDEVSLGGTAVGRSNSDATAAVPGDDFYNPEKSFGSRRSVSMPPTAAVIGGGGIVNQNQYPQQKSNSSNSNNYRGGGNMNNYAGGNSHSSRAHHQQYQGDSDSFLPPASVVVTGGSIGSSNGGALLPPSRLAPNAAPGHRQQGSGHSYSTGGVSGKGSHQQQHHHQGGSSLPSRSTRPSDPSPALYSHGDFNLDYFQTVAPNTNIIPPSGHGMYGGSSFLDDAHSAAAVALEPNSRSSSGHTTSSNGTFSGSHFNQGGESSGLHSSSSLSRNNSGSSNNHRNKNQQAHNDASNGNSSISSRNNSNSSLPSTGNMYKQQQHQHGKNSVDASPAGYFKNPDLQLVDRTLSRNNSNSNSGHTVGGVGGGGGSSAVLFNSKTTGSGHHHNSNGYFKPSSIVAAAAVDEPFSMQHFDNPSEPSSSSSSEGGRSPTLLFGGGGGGSKSMVGVDASSLHHHVVGSLHHHHVVGGSSGNSSYFKHSSSSSVGVAGTSEDQFSMQHFDAAVAAHSSLLFSSSSDEPKINQWTSSALITDPQFDAPSDKELKRVCLPPGLRSSKEGTGSSPPGLIGSDRSLSPPGLQKRVRGSSSLVILDPNGMEVLPLVTAAASSSVDNSNISSSSQLDLIVKRIPGLSLKDEPAVAAAVVVAKEEFVVVDLPADDGDDAVQGLSVASSSVDECPPKSQQLDGAAAVVVGLQQQQEGSSKAKQQQRTLKDFFRPVAK